MLTDNNPVTTPTTLVLTGTLGFCVWAAIKLAKCGQREPALPPGPPTQPLVGNMLMLPTVTPYLGFTEWAAQYGGIYSLKIAHQTFIVLSSLEAVHDILDKQSALSSDRPSLHLRDLVEGQDNNLVLARYSSRWKAMRRMAQQILSPQACLTHLAIQQAEGIQLVYDLLREPERLHGHLRRVSTSVITAVMFGVRTPRSTTPIFVDFWDMLERSTHLDAPTSHPPVDVFPILKYIPEIFAAWKTKCRELKALQDRVLNELVKMVKQRLDQGVGNGCYMEEVYLKAQEYGLDEEAILPFGFVMVAAGADTATTVMQNFVLFLAAHPEVQKKVQDEMDQVVGSDRMPELDDFDGLPYLKAVINETHRLRPVAPLSVPHAASEDIRYRDYVIPKGATIFQNTWGLLHDPAVFEDPESFKPERFIKDPSLEKYVNHVFGSGRRFCVGIHLAQNALKINTMNLAWAFNFSKALDESGKTIELDLFSHTKQGVVSRPEDFRASIKPRSVHHERVLRQAMRDSAEAFRPFEYDLAPDDKAFAERARTEA